jgi:hypothetical protein
MNGGVQPLALVAGEKFDHGIDQLALGLERTNSLKKERQRPISRILSASLLVISSARFTRMTTSAAATSLAPLTGAGMCSLSLMSLTSRNF